MNGEGRVFQRGSRWWIGYYRSGREWREGVHKVLRKPAEQCTRGDAEEALRLRVRGKLMAVAPGLLPRIRRAAFTPADWKVVEAAERIPIAQAPLIFESAELKLMVGAIVYGYFREGRPLYVGRSLAGIARPSGPQHHQLGPITREGVRPSDHLVMWPVGSEAEASELEERLIKELQPDLNRKSRTALRTAAVVG